MAYATKSAANQKPAHREVLVHGLFELPLMRSRVTTDQMTMHEKILGYLVGPAGMMVYMALVNQLQELYLTSVFYVDRLYGVGTYLAITWATRVIALFAGFGLGWLVDHTVSSQGKIRPYVLMGSLLSIVSGFFCFWIPDIGSTGRLVWFVVFYVLLNAFGVTAYNLRANMVTLSTRNQDDRTFIGTLGNVGSYMIAGVAVGLIVSSVIYYQYLSWDMSGTNWVILMGIGAGIATPLCFVEYFFTKERVTLEDRAAEEREDAPKQGKLPLREQLRAIVTNRYWLLGTAMLTIITINNYLRGQNITTNFCQVILGADAQNNYQLIFTILSGLPLGLGIFIAYPLCRKFTIRKTAIIFDAIFIAGVLISMVNPYDFVTASVGTLVMNFGSLVNIYVLSVLWQSANDAVEYESGFRIEGSLAASIPSAVITVITGLFSGVYETGLAATGYDVTLGMAQPVAVQQWVIFVMFVVQAICYGLLIVILLFYDLEDKLPAMQAELEQRHKQEAAGEAGQEG